MPLIFNSPFLRQELASIPTLLPYLHMNMDFQYILKMADGRKLKGSKKQRKGLQDKANSKMKDTELYIFLIILEHFRSVLFPHLPLGESEGNEVFPAFFDLVTCPWRAGKSAWENSKPEWTGELPVSHFERWSVQQGSWKWLLGWELEWLLRGF